MTKEFDSKASNAAKTNGMQCAAWPPERMPGTLDLARTLAQEIARAGDGTCHMDLVGQRLSELGFSVGPWSGSVFKGKSWSFTGYRVRSARVTNHARELKVWRFTP